jgi:hypothetical protein
MDKFKLLISFLVSFFIMPLALAAITISATPYRGGSDLRFGQVQNQQLNSQEVTVRINSSESKQYQVYQRIIEPITNEQGMQLSRDALTATTLIGSNSSGTLYGNQATLLSYSDQLVYTSNNGGNSDSFVIVYNIDPAKFNISGNFYGKIMLTVRTVDGELEKNTIIDVSGEMAKNFNIYISDYDQAQEIVLNNQRKIDSTDYFQLTFSDNFNSNLKIYQEVMQYPEDTEQNQINPEIFSFYTEGAQAGDMFYQNPSSIDRRRMLLYEADASTDSLSINFVLNQDQLSQQEAGVYEGRLRYLITRDGIEAESFLVNLKLTIEAVFKLNVEFGSPEGLAFNELMPDSLPQKRDVGIEVDSNTGRPYIVTQQVKSPLVNKQGDIMPQELFTVKVETQAESEGESLINDFTTVAEGETALFNSDEAGSPTNFKIIYRLKPDVKARPGQYSTVISYSLQEK